jgi:hypothetical protein
LAPVLAAHGEGFRVAALPDAPAAPAPPLPTSTITSLNVSCVAVPVATTP